MDSNNHFNHRGYWDKKQEMKTLDLKNSNTTNFVLEMQNYHIQCYRNQDPFMLTRRTKTPDTEINYKRIFENGVCKETLSNAFFLADLKLKTLIKENIAFKKLNETMKDVAQRPLTFKECYPKNSIL